MRGDSIDPRGERHEAGRRERASPLSRRRGDSIDPRGERHEAGRRERASPLTHRSRTHLFAALLLKDFRTELRAKDALFTATFFSIVAVLIFSFALFDPSAARRLAPGVVWVATTFATTFLFSRAFAREVEIGTLDALLTSGIPRPLIFLSKWVVNFTFSLAIGALLSVLAALLFMAPIERDIGMWAATIVLGLVGLTAVGTLLSAMVASARVRDSMLPIALYPIAVPNLIAAVKMSQAVIDGGTLDIGPWVTILVLFDVVFGVASLWLFGLVVEE